MAFLIPTITHPARGRRGTARRRRRAALCRAVPLLLAMAAFWITLSADGQTSREFQLKAVFLFNFAQFTEWPTNSYTNQAPIVIGVLGSDPFGQALEDTIRGETVQGRKLVVERYRRLEDLQPCQILYIAPPETRRMERVLDALGASPTLTVSDAGGAVGNGVMIRFVQENNRIRLRINLDAIDRARLTVSSKLLRAAEVTSTSGRQP